MQQSRWPQSRTLRLTVTTTSQYTLVGYGVRNGTWLVGRSALTGLGLLLVRRRAGAISTLLSLLLAALLAGGLSGCSGKLPSLNPVFTPPGVYPVRLSATDGTLTRTAAYTLTVVAHD